MNKVVLMGRLTRDPEVRYSQGENAMAIARFTVAVDRRGSRNSQDGQTADFISCVAFGRQGEFVEKYFHKGNRISLSGRIQTGSYTNKEGAKVYTTEVIAEDVEFAESKSESGNSGFDGGSNNSFQAQPSMAPSGASPDFMQIPDGIDEELPFT